jgi:hypothetical protein
MADTAAHLVDRVLPEAPVRQWVLSLPWVLRFRLAYDRSLCSAVLALFVRTLFSALRRRAAKQHGVARGQCGAVTFVQRFGDALDLNLLGLVAFWMATEKSPDCADEVPCDFRAECAKAQHIPSEEFTSPGLPPRPEIR